MRLVALIRPWFRSSAAGANYCKLKGGKIGLNAVIRYVERE